MNPKDHLLAHERLLRFAPIISCGPTHKPRTKDQQLVSFDAAFRKRERRNDRRLREVKAGGWDARKRASAG